MRAAHHPIPPGLAQSGCVHLLGDLAADHLPELLGVLGGMLAFQVARRPPALPLPPQVVGLCLACCLGTSNRVDAWEQQG